MMKAIPGTNLRGVPHINSKITMWKRAHASLSTMFQKETGVGYNHVTHVIDATDDQWEKVLKIDPNANGMRHKSWPMYDSWNEIFGKDRANGAYSRDIMESVNELMNEDDHMTTEPQFESNGDPTMEPIEIEVNSQPNQSGNSSKSTGKKRAAADVGDDKLYDLLGQMQRSTEEKLDNITRVLGYESDIGLARERIFSMLDGISGMTLDDKIDVSHLLAKNVECLQMFRGLPEEARARYIDKLLKNELC